ncbi:MAG: hypothetical protein H3Z53_08565 [archaeon]|nr:hypothetical protein [archaeon]MCP8317289.1 hypothetical protein [archaeon]MCP8319813.1 hypothetical protein [archaeon]
MILHFSLIILATSVNILFGLVKMINLFSIRFYYFYSLNVINITIFSPSIDWWIWCISLLLIIVEMFIMRFLYGLSLPHWTIFPYSLLIASFAIFLVDNQVATFLTILLGFIVTGLSIFYSKGFLFARREEVVLLVSIGIIGLLIPLELASLSSWVMNAFDYEVPFGPSPRWRFPLIDLNLFNVLYPLTSWLFLILLYCWIWIPISRYLFLRMRRNDFSSIHLSGILERQPLTLVLFITLVVAVFVAYYPYIHLPPPALVGVDTLSGANYYGFLTRMVEDGAHVSLMSDRPIFFLLIYFIKIVTMQPSYFVIRIMPAICATGLALATFWFVKTGTNDDHLALLSSIFSVFSFQTTAGMYGYLLANWFIIIEMMLFFTFLLKSLEKHSIIYSLIAGLISIAALLTHPYTWLIMISILFSYITLTFLIRSGIRKDILFLLIPLVIIIMVFVPYFIYFSGSMYGTSSFWGFVEYMLMVMKNINISNFVDLQPALSLMVQRWVGGAFGNPLIIALAILGMASMADLSKSFHRLVLCWILVPSLAFFLIVSSQEWLYWRIVYVIPFQIPAAIGLYWLLNKLRSMLHSSSTTTKTYFRLFQILIVAFILLFLFNYSLRSVDMAMIQIPES